MDNREPGMGLTGVLIAESVRSGSVVELPPLMVTRISRLPAGEESAGQPRVWTLIDFQAPAGDAAALAESLASVLDQAPAWYADFRSATETFVVFPGRIFRYPRGSSADRAAAVAYGRELGIPVSQLDWPV